MLVFILTNTFAQIPVTCAASWQSRSVHHARIYFSQYICSNTGDLRCQLAKQVRAPCSYFFIQCICLNTGDLRCQLPKQVCAPCSYLLQPYTQMNCSSGDAHAKAELDELLQGVDPKLLEPSEQVWKASHRNFTQEFHTGNSLHKISTQRQLVQDSRLHIICAQSDVEKNIVTAQWEMMVQGVRNQISPGRCRIWMSESKAMIVILGNNKNAVSES